MSLTYTSSLGLHTWKSSVLSSSQEEKNQYDTSKDIIATAAYHIKPGETRHGQKSMRCVEGKVEAA